MERAYPGPVQALHSLTAFAVSHLRSADRFRNPVGSFTDTRRLGIPGWVAVPIVGAGALAITVGLAGSAIRPEPVPIFPTEEPSGSGAASHGDHSETQLPVTVNKNIVIVKDIPSNRLIYDENKAVLGSVSELDRAGNLTTSVKLTGDDGTEAIVTDNGNGTYTVIFK